MKVLNHKNSYCQKDLGVVPLLPMLVAATTAPPCTYNFKIEMTSSCAKSFTGAKYLFRKEFSGTYLAFTSSSIM